MIMNNRLITLSAMAPYKFVMFEFCLEFGAFFQLIVTFIGFPTPNIWNNPANMRSTMPNTHHNCGLENNAMAIVFGIVQSIIIIRPDIFVNEQNIIIENQNWILSGFEWKQRTNTVLEKNYFNDNNVKEKQNKAVSYYNLYQFDHRTSMWIQWESHLMNWLLCENKHIQYNKLSLSC